MMILLYGIDKYKAIHHHWRVSEKILLIGALFGGSLGAILAMYGLIIRLGKIFLSMEYLYF